MEYAVVLDRNVDGRWTVTCPVLPGCISEGNTREDAIADIKDAIALYLRAVRKELSFLKQRHHAHVARVAV